MKIYQKIDANDYRNIYVVGDLHGCYSLLKEKMQEVLFDPQKDLIIAVGDLIDRGNENIACLELLQQPWFVSVYGNHEEIALDALKTGDGNFWERVGGRWFFDLTEEQKAYVIPLIKACEELPYIIEVTVKKGRIRKAKTYVIAHSCYPRPYYYYDQLIDLQKTIWDRDNFLINTEEDNPQKIKGADYFIYGHNGVKEVTQVNNQIYIDTGSVFTQNLTLFKIT